MGDVSSEIPAPSTTAMLHHPSLSGLLPLLLPELPATPVTVKTGSVSGRRVFTGWQSRTIRGAGSPLRRHFGNRVKRSGFSVGYKAAEVALLT